ncbi:MAG: hypothetical protein ACKN94_03785 [Pirellulaceae bacterium]
MVYPEKPLDRRNRLIEWLLFCLIPAPAFFVGWKHGANNRLLIDTDSYNRVNRVEAILETGRWLHQVPRDNGGASIPIHWSHALDGWIVGFSRCLAPWVHSRDAVLAAGAVIGPLSILALAWAAMSLVRRATGLQREALLAGILIAASPAIASYGALGRADYHVLLPAVAIAMFALLLQCPSSNTTTSTSNPGFQEQVTGHFGAFVSGLLGGIGIWISPEAFPFAMAAWAMATLMDIERTGGWDQSSCRWSSGFLVAILAAWIADPPSGGLLAIEIDRLSRPYVELAIGLTLVTFVGAAILRPKSQRWTVWGSSLLHGMLGTACMGLWLAIYPDAARGTQGIFSKAMTERVWSKLAELQPLDDWSRWTESGLFPCLAIALTLSAIPLRFFRRPLVVLHLMLLLFVVAITAKHVRFAVYLQTWAAILSASGWYWATRFPVAPWRQAIWGSACLLLVFGPIAVAPWLRSTGSSSPPASNWSRSTLAKDLEPFAGKIVLVPINQSPEAIYYSRCVCTAGPYHRAEVKMAESLDAFEEKQWASAPLSFQRTGASLVLIFQANRFPQGSLGSALQSGTCPDWLRPIGGGTEHGYRIYQLRPRSFH